MYYAMEVVNEGYRSFQRAIRTSPFKTLKAAIKHASKKSNHPFVCKGITVVWNK